MKAHVVKGNVFAVVFLLGRAFLRGRGGSGWLGDRLLRFSFLWFLLFVPGWLAILLRRESCIRRGFRHEPVRIGCRIHPET
jgi:hypothetical protein